MISSSTLRLLLLLHVANICYGQTANPNDEPLILTKYLYNVNTNITQIQLLSQTGNISGVTNYPTYSGFFNVNDEYNSNIFFWFVPTPMQNMTQKYPLIVWLTSGNGVSGLLSAIGEFGPFQLSSDGIKLEPRENSWSSMANLLFIDAPVGTGFSFTENEDGYACNSSDVAQQIFTSLMQFFKVFPEYLNNDLYLAAESYAARYTATLSYRIYYENPYLECPLNIKGVINISPEFDYRYMINISSQLFSFGLLSESECEVFQKQESEVAHLLNLKAYGTAMSAFNSLILGQFWPTLTTYQTLTGLESYKNIDQPYNSYNYSDVVTFLNRPDIRQAFHAGNATFQNASVVIGRVYDDVMVSYTPWLQDMLNKGYKWLMVLGQFGILVNPVDFNCFIDSINWKASDEYAHAERNHLMLDNEVVAYVTPVKNLALATVLQAGQVVAADKPNIMANILQKFLLGNI
ncbi:hypothetical protein CHUAL_004650 [Chamberlinius hualienensis]